MQDLEVLENQNYILPLRNTKDYYYIFFYICNWNTKGLPIFNLFPYYVGILHNKIP